MDVASWQLNEYAAIEGGGANSRPAPPSLLDAFTGRGAFKHITLQTQKQGAAEGGTSGGIKASFDSGLAALALRLVWWASSAALAPSLPGGDGRCLSPEEEGELTRRKRMWALYLLRSPLFERCTVPAAERVAAGAGYVPLLGWVAQFAVGMLGYYNKVHFYSSGSN
jgi:hypothetical protein